MKSDKWEKKIEETIEEATVDTYSESEALAGWESVLDDNIKTLQKCMVNGEDAILAGISSSGVAVHAVVKFEKLKKRITVPIGQVELKDENQDIYIRAYEEHFSGKII